MFFPHFKHVTYCLSTENRYHDGMSGPISVDSFHDTCSSVTFHMVDPHFSDTLLAFMYQDKKTKTFTK